MQLIHGEIFTSDVLWNALTNGPSSPDEVVEQFAAVTALLRRQQLAIRRLAREIDKLHDEV